ncbi:ATP-binding protein [Granulicella mallensis]|uniref:histidine kinase n=1 Tax=Granulicella mallensis TaxID=940614 RepID=A0A7W8E9S7_9BACT|nr:ATP-binding protein [Granulicella mallensis]MBB5064803.1 two-component system sensor histidine kinase KdpD [Granulicella mallensis]
MSVRLRSVIATLAACVLVVAFGAINVRHTLGLATMIPLYMLLTLLVAWRVGFRAAMVVSICATVSLDLFFSEPLFTLRVASPENITALATFICVSLLVSYLSHTVRRTDRALQRHDEQQLALYELLQRMLLLDWRESVGIHLSMLVQQCFHLDGVGLWEAHGERFAWTGDAEGASESLRAALLADRDVDSESRKEAIRVLRSGTRPVGAVLLRGDLIDPLMASAIGTLMASALERARALKAEVVAESEKLSEQLRSAVLDGLAHAVKTPLTTIAISSAGLSEIGGLTPVQIELVDLIEGQASRLSSLTNKLLRTSRLDVGEMKLHRKPLELRALLQATIEELGSEFDTERLHTHFEEGLAIEGDRELLSMALAQILENALKYSPAASAIELSAKADGGSVILSIHNDGSYIPVEERALIFRRFYRSQDVEHRAPGTGIGLSVALRAVEAHGGELWVESERDTGTTFSISLPAKGLSISLSA